MQGNLWLAWRLRFIEKCKDYDAVIKFTALLFFYTLIGFLVCWVFAGLIGECGVPVFIGGYLLCFNWH